MQMMVILWWWWCWWFWWWWRALSRHANQPVSASVGFQFTLPSRVHEWPVIRDKC